MLLSAYSRSGNRSWFAIRRAHVFVYPHYWPSLDDEAADGAADDGPADDGPADDGAADDGSFKPG